MNVVIVESAAKAKTINKYLGSGFKVIPSYGHVRDLPSKDGSVEPDKDFEMHWDVDGRSQKVMKEIAAAVQKHNAKGGSVVVKAFLSVIGISAMRVGPLQLPTPPVIW